MKKKILILLLAFGIIIGITVSDVYAKYILDKSVNAVSLEVSTLYNIDYNLNGGTISDEISKYTVNHSFTLPNPSKKGYEFEGWNGSNGEIPVKNVVIQKGTNGNLSYNANWQLINYTINYNLNGGILDNQISNYNTENNTFTLGIPSRIGYEFAGWTGSNGSQPNKLVGINKGTTGNLSYSANWTKNYYTVNYYVNGGIWQQRSVGYNDALENLNAQSILDNYHTFHGWNGWVNNMPANNVNLYANITESYCQLTTGHGPYGNAAALLKVFNQAGWTGTIQEAYGSPGNYLVVTDLNLTRAQAEVQKNYIASHTNYTNYNYPYLYWVAVSCTNGYGEAWTRGRGQANFN